MKHVIFAIITALSVNSLAESFTFEQLCQKQVENILDENNNDDKYSYSTSHVELIDSVVVEGNTVAEYSVRTYLDGPYDGVARSDYSITYSLKDGLCQIEEPILIKEHDILD